jgi:hypothetical protein
VVLPKNAPLLARDPAGPPLRPVVTRLPSGRQAMNISPASRVE